jgi:Zn-dependent protease with chaperone function
MGATAEGTVRQQSKMKTATNTQDIDGSTAARGFVQWLAPKSVALSPAENTAALSPDDMSCLRAQGWLTNGEVLAIYAYSRAAAIVDATLAPKVKSLRLKAEIPEDFEKICSSVLPPAIFEAGRSLSVNEVFRNPPLPLAKAVASAFSLYKLESGRHKRTRLPGLRSIAFEHPSDRSALAVLKALPGFGAVAKKTVGFFKRSDEMAVLGGAMLVTERSMPSIMEILVEACEILGIASPPPLYIKSGQMESYSLGADEPHIVVGSIAVSLFTRDEMLFLLGHELGHIKAGHAPYHTLAKGMKDAAALASTLTLGLAGFAFDATVSPLLAIWSRRSEFTADRAGYLACQDQEVALRALMKLAGYPPPLYSRMHTRSIVAQANRFRNALADHAVNRFFNVSNLWNASHPNTVLRAYELLEWLQEGVGTDILKMSPAELKRYEDTVEQDPCLAELREEVIRTVAGWAQENCQVYRGAALRLSREMINSAVSAKGTQLERILQIQLTLKKSGAETIEHWVYLLVNQGGQPARIGLPVARDASWDALPAKYREDFIRSGQSEMSWNLYEVI